MIELTFSGPFRNDSGFIVGEGTGRIMFSASAIDRDPSAARGDYWQQDVTGAEMQLSVPGQATPSVSPGDFGVVVRPDAGGGRGLFEITGCDSANPEWCWVFNIVFSHTLSSDKVPALAVLNDETKDYLVAAGVIRGFPISVELSSTLEADGSYQFVQVP